MHWAAGILSLACVGSSVIGPLLVLGHLCSHRAATVDLGKHCILGICIADLLWGVSNVFYLGLSGFDVGFYFQPANLNTHSVCVWVCEHSVFGCALVGFFGISANAAVGIWSNCLAHYIYRGVCVEFCVEFAQTKLHGSNKQEQEPSSPNSAETRARSVAFYRRLYSVTGCLLPLLIGTVGLVWSTQNVGLGKVGWLYPSVWVLVGPVLFSWLFNATAFGSIYWQLSTHASPLNKQRFGNVTGLYIVVTAVSWGPYLIYMLCMVGFRGADHTPTKHLEALYWVWLFMVSCGIWHSVIYFCSVNAASKPLWERHRYVQFQRAHIKDGDSDAWRATAAVVSQEYGVETVEAIVQDLSRLRPEADEGRLLELLHGIAALQGTRLADLAQDPYGDRLLEALVEAECRELDQEEREGGKLLPSVDEDQGADGELPQVWREPPSPLEEQLAGREARRRSEAKRRGSIGQGNLLRIEAEPDEAEEDDDAGGGSEAESTEPPGSPRLWDIAGWSPGLSPGLNELARPLVAPR